MKKLITTVLTAMALLLASGLHAEEMVLDSVYLLEWDGSASDWQVDGKEYYTYTDGKVASIKSVSDDEITIEVFDANENLVEEIEMELDDTVWVYTEKMLYTYEGANVIEETEQAFDTVWVNVERRLKGYDTYDNLISWYDEVWDAETESWTTEEGEIKTTKEFDANGQEIAKNEKEYQSGTWVDSKIYTYTLNNDGLVTEIQAKELEDGKWVNASANALYTYDEKGNIATLVWNKAASDSAIGDYSVKYRKWDYEYDAAGNVLLETQYRNTTSAGDYKTYYQYTYAYDSVGNMTMKIKDKYNSDYTGFDPYRKYISHYDAYGNEIYDLELRANSDLDGYYDYRLYTSAYTEDGVQILDRRDDFEEGEWMTTREYDYTIDDATGWVTEIQARDWNDSVWVNTSANAIYQYDSVGNVVVELWNKSADGAALGVYDVLYYKWLRTYDEAGNLLLEERFKGNADNDGYDIYRKNTYVYDSLGNEVYELQEREDDGEYYSYNEYIQSYDENSNLIEKIWNNKTTDKTALKTYRKYTYEYNEAGQQTLYLYQKANTADTLLYDNYEQEISTYSAEGYLTGERTEEWDDSVWVLDEATLYDITVDADGLLTKSIEMETSDDVAFDTLEMVENFYSEGLLDSVYYSDYEAGVWVLVEKEYYTYEDSMLVSMIVDELDERMTYAYDEKGNVVSELGEDLVDGEWMNIDKRIREFDDNGEVTMYFDKIWDETYLWTMKSGSVMRKYLYNEDGVKIDETQSAWVSAYSELNEEVVAELTEETVGDVFMESILFSVTEDDENYENVEKEVYYYSEPQASAINERAETVFGHLYPNPAISLVNLPAGDYNFSVYSVEGHMMISGSRATQATISVANMTKGIYLIQYQGKDTTETERFVVR